MNLIKNNKLIIKILGLIILLISFDIYFDYYYTDYVKEQLDEFLIYLGLKERPKEEPFLGMIISILGSVGMTVGMAVTAVLFITLATKWVINLGIGIGEAILGSLLTTIKGSFQIALGIPDLGIFVLYIVRWIIDHIICFMQLIFSLPYCIFFYIVALVGQVLYLPFRAFFYICYIMGIKKIYKHVDKFWQKVYDTDEWIFTYVMPIHFAHFPQSVRDKCFTCVRLKMDSVGTKYMPVHKRFGETLPRYVRNDVRMMGRGFSRIIQSFTKFP